MSKCPHLDDPEFNALIDKMVERYPRDSAGGIDPVRMTLKAGYGERYSCWPAMRLEEVLAERGIRCSARSWTGPGFTSMVSVSRDNREQPLT